MGDFIKLSQNTIQGHSQRIFEMDGEWFFKTRYGIEGPFKDRLEVEQKLSSHLDIFENLELSQMRSPIHPAHTHYHTLQPSQLQWRWR